MFRSVMQIRTKFNVRFLAMNITLFKYTACLPASPYYTSIAPHVNYDMHVEPPAHVVTCTKTLTFPICFIHVYIP